MGDPGNRGAYKFGPFQLDVRERRLSRGSEVIPLRLKVFDTLRILVENAGRLITKQELLDTVWPDAAVEENNLNHNVSVLRKVLGEKATGQQVHRDCPPCGLSLRGRGRGRPSRHPRPSRRRRRHQGTPLMPIRRWPHPTGDRFLSCSRSATVIAAAATW